MTQAVPTMTAEEVHAGLAIGEFALANHAQMVAESQTSRAAIYDPMRIEADARPRRVQVPHVSCSTLV